jgi:hypothetical protein
MSMAPPATIRIALATIATAAIGAIAAAVIAAIVFTWTIQIGCGGRKIMIGAVMHVAGCP